LGQAAFAGGAGGAVNTAGSPGFSGSGAGGGGGGVTRSNTLAAGAGGNGASGDVIAPAWTSTAGPTAGPGGGAGGGGGRVPSFTGAGGNGGAGGSYGGGGGGGGWSSGTKGIGGAGAPGIIVLTYYSDSGPLTISSSVSTTTPMQPGEATTITVSRNKGTTYPAVPVTVSYGGTAANGIDYSITGLPPESGNTVLIPANTKSKSFTVTVQPALAASKTFTFSVQSDPSYSVASPSSYTIQLVPPPTLSISGSINDNTGVATITWSSTTTDSCSVSGPSGFSASGTSGTKTTTPGTTPAVYTLSCSTPVGSRSASTTVASIGVLKNGLINYWTLDAADISGTTAADVSPNACSPGILYNSPTATTGHYGTANSAMSFNGSNTYIESPTVGITNTISVSAWVYSSNFNQNSMIVEKEQVNTQWGLFFEGGLLKWRGGSMAEITASLPSNNAWHHIVATQNGTTAKLYVDGVLVKTGTVAAIGNSTYYYNTINIGRYNNGYYFNGKIDDVLVWSRELSAGDVTSLYSLPSSAAAALRSAAPSAAAAGPAVETVAGYTPAAPATYGLPIYSEYLSGFSGNSDGRPDSKPQPLQAAATPDDVSSAWYAGTPSPLTCYQNTMGVCMYLGGLQGIRVAVLKATPLLVSSQASSPLSNGLAALWSLDSGSISGTAVADDSGNNNIATLVNGPTAAAGHWGDSNNARSLNGSNSYITTAYQIPAQSSGTSFTWSAWVKLNSSSQYAVLLGFRNGSTWAKLTPSSFEYGNGSIISSSIPTGSWVHVAIVKNGQNFTYYRNGVSVGTASNSGSVVSSPFYIGSDPAYTSDGVISGAIDEVMVWNRALSASEISSLYGLSASGALALHASVGAPTIGGLDIVSSNPLGACGVPVTHWSYVQTAPVIKVPKYTQVRADYLCQPSQEYLWSQNRGYCSWPASCDASTVSQRIFRFADKAKINGTATSSLSGSSTKTVSTVLDLTLQCGGFVPEEGKQVGLRPIWPSGTDGFGSDHPIEDFNGDFQQAANPIPQNIGLPQFYNMDRRSACWTYCYWPWTWAYYNAASTTYYQPPAVVSVQACADNEIVVNNACTPCPTGQYRSGNMCTNNPPPTATIQANGAGFTDGHNGRSVTVPAGDTLTIAATYTSGVAPATQTVVLTSGTTWTVPSDWTTSGSSIEVIGAGGSGGVALGTNNSLETTGGGGGGYSKVTDINLTPGATLSYKIGVGGPAVSRTTNGSTNGNTGGDTYFCNSNSNCGSISDTAVLVGAKGGVGGGAKTSLSSTAGGAGGAASGGIGTVKYSGGAGGGITGSPSARGSTGGGGAAGPSGAGVNGVSLASPSNVSSEGGAGDAGLGGAGGTSSAYDGGAGTEWDLGHGSGGGGRGRQASSAGSPGNGGAYGGGGGGGNVNLTGGPATSGAGQTGIIVIKYLNGDPISATAINNDAAGNSVDCGLVSTFNGVSTTTYTTGGGCETFPDANKTYSFIPSINDIGTQRYSAQIKTTSYPNYNGYAYVDVTVTCWDNSHQVGNTCVCDPHYTQQGNACVLDECTNNNAFPGIQATVPPGCVQSTDGTFICTPIPGSGYVAGGGECAPPGPPSDITLTFTPARVRSGSDATITWSGTNVPPQCTISSDPAVPGLPLIASSTITGNSEGVTIGPITQNTNITLTCPSVVVGSGVAKKAVGIIPVYREI
jgi:hypothetical protein